MEFLFIGLIGYLIGSLSPAAVLAKIKHVNLKEEGTKNLGATNTALVLGRAFGIFVMLFDIMKSFCASRLARWLFPALEYADVTAGVACVLGHIFPVFMKFRGGKGLAAYIGMILALNWKFALVIAVMVLLVTVITDYIVAGTTLTIVTVPVYLGIAEHSVLLALTLCIATAVIVYKHRMNYVRIYKGTEIGLRSVMKGKHRMK